MSLTKSAYEALKNIVLIQTRIDELTQSIGTVSQKVEGYNARVTAKLEEHAERLARLEGKFELIETSLGARRKRLPE